VSNPRHAVTAAGFAVRKNCSAGVSAGISSRAFEIASAAVSYDGLSEPRMASQPPSCSALWNASVNSFSERCRSSPRVGLASCAVAYSDISW
jgi:hypothetical protein